MSDNKILNTRIQQKHDIEANWLKAVNFIPKIGEIIVYDPDEHHAASRVKIGDGVKTIIELAFIDKTIQDYVDNKIQEALTIDYSLLAFDTTEIVFGTNISNILGQAILGQLVLA